MNSNNLAALRENYQRDTLTEESTADDPFTQFTKWFTQAADAGLREPNAMTLATADKEGNPDARIVLLKGMDERGFVFFTNYTSAKGRQLHENPKASLVFFWNELERQVRISGAVEKAALQESAMYFSSRPYESRLGAWVSRQSEVIHSREELQERLEEIKLQYPTDVPLPPFWGGYRVVPHRVEFWQGRSNRLHDRILYHTQGDGCWDKCRLSP